MKKSMFVDRRLVIVGLAIFFMFSWMIDGEKAAGAQGLNRPTGGFEMGSGSLRQLPGRAEAFPSQEKRGLNELLLPDGTLDLRSGYRGSLDATGYRLVSGPGEAPRFRAASNQEDERWSDEFAERGVNGGVSSLAVDGSGNFFLGGFFTNAGSVSAYFIAHWDGSGWSALGTGLNDWVYALVLDGDGNLYVGGRFSTAGDIPANNIARWDGSAWSALGSGLDHNVYSLAVDFRGNVYAAGWFWTAGDVPANNIARWDGSAWSALGSGLDNGVSSIAVDGNGNLYAGGSFTTAGGVPANYIARWDGSSWSALGSGMNNHVAALAVDGNGNLYAGGNFTNAGGVPANNIARWDGSSWSALGSGMNNHVAALAVDSNGNVYAGGDFTSAGGVPANYIARWDGTSWSALGSGMNDRVSTLALNGLVDLYAGGAFTEAGGKDSQHIAKWAAERPSIAEISPTLGPVGTVVTLIGTNFRAIRNASTVKFNGVEATSFISWSDTEILCNVPPGATTGPVTVTTDSGTSNGMTFTVISVPVIQSISPDSGRVGTEVTLTGTGFRAKQYGSIVSFNGVSATKFISWSDTLIKCKVPKKGTTGLVRIIGANGVLSNGVTFTVKP
jgi:hypothetical protein